MTQTFDHEKDMNALLIESIARKQSKSRTNYYICISGFFTIVVGILVVVLYTFVISKENGLKSKWGELYGEWPVYGGNLQNQQIPFNPHKVKINAHNVDKVRELCFYNNSLELMNSFTGYIVVDDNNHGFFADHSGYVIGIDLNTCFELFRLNIAVILGYNESTTQLVSRNSLTLYIDNDGHKSLMVATPNKRSYWNATYPIDSPCWLFSINLNKIHSVSYSSVSWILNLGEGSDYFSCLVHSTIISDNHAYCGLSSDGYAYPPYDTPENTFKGRVFKISLHNTSSPQIVNTFSTIPDGYDNYVGAGIWPIISMIDDYLIVPVGDLVSYPTYIADCLNDSNPYTLNTNRSQFMNNPCSKNELSDDDILSFQENKWWRCLESNIYVDSLLILNKNDLSLELNIALQGIDAWNVFCMDEFSALGECPLFPGPDADLTQVVPFYNENDELIIAAHQKSGQFYLWKITQDTNQLDYELLISKKIGPWSISGGASVWSLAVDAKNMIAVTTITGSISPGSQYEYKYYMADGKEICETGSIHAINLTNGETLYQIVNPYGYIGNQQCNNTKYDAYVDYSDNDKNIQICQTNSIDIEHNISVIYPPKITSLTYNYTMDFENRGKFMGGITISNELIFIPSISGDVFIHNLLDGSFITQLQCKDYLYLYGNQSVLNRAGIRSGVTVFKDSVIFYCGADMRSESVQGNQVASFKLH